MSRVWAVSIAILVGSLLFLDIDYQSDDLGAKLIWIELSLTTIFVLGTLFVFSPAALGLLRPRKPTRDIIPMLAVLSLSVAAFALTRQFRPHGEQWGQGFLGVAMVGFTEEWMYRGLLLAFFSSKLGLRGGALVSTLCFGAIHSMNILAGVTPAQSKLQVVFTALTGATLLLGALSCRSIWPAVICHGLYDFCVMQIRATSDEASGIVALLPVFGILTFGTYSTVRIFKLPKEPRRSPYLQSSESS